MHFEGAENSFIKCLWVTVTDEQMFKVNAMVEGVFEIFGCRSKSAKEKCG